MPDYPRGVTSPSQFGRPTTYVGIPMRSRTEAKYAQWLDEWGEEWAYEPRCYAGPVGQYLPDFRKEHRLPDGSIVSIFVEVKASIPPDIRSLQARMEIIWLSEPEAGLEIAVLGYADVDLHWLGVAGRGWQLFDYRAVA